MAPLKSEVWKYFDKYDKQAAKCKLCFRTIKYCGNTTNLLKHAKIHGTSVSKVRDTRVQKSVFSKQSEHKGHADASNCSTIQPCNFSSEKHISSTSTANCLAIEFSPSMPSPSSENVAKLINTVQQPIVEAFGKMLSHEEGGARHSAITMCLLFLICKDMRPFNIVEGEGFKHLMKEVAPSYKIPSASYIKKKLSEKYEATALIYKKRLSSITNVCITTDIWTENMSERSFIGMTVHFLEGIQTVNCTITKDMKSNHTAEYIAKVLKEILDEWNIAPSTISCIVTDNAPNIVSAAKIVAGDKNHLPCFAHTINLVLEAALEVKCISMIITKVREIVKWVKNSVINSDKLRKIQIHSGVAEGSVKKLIMDVKTRWNSTFYMIDRFIEMKKIISEMLFDNTGGPEMLTATEIDVVNQLTALLRPFEFVTKEASAEKYITISKVIPFVSCIISELDKFKSTSAVVIEVQQCLTKEIRRRFGNIELNTHVALATLLDPRFKNLHFQDPSACGRAIYKLKELFNFDVTQTTSSEEDDEQSASSKYDFWKHHKDLAHGQKKKKFKRADELTVYLGNPVCALKTNPLEEWEEKKCVFPLLYKQARTFLVVTATSVPCERLFSKAGGTITKTRNRLSGKHLEKLLFLGGLSQEEWFH